MLAASTFAIHVTYTCPLTCAHCCFASSPSVKDRLDPEFVLQCIDELPSNIDLVAFTGGEPFLMAKDLPRFVARAKQRGFKTRIVTSAYFGKNKTYARKRVQEVHDAGLDELSISWDDYHEAFVAFECIRNVAEAAVDLGVSTAISSVQSVETVWTRDKINAELGSISERLSVVCESQLNLTGRAEEELRDHTFKPEGFLGPCPYVMTGPTLSAKGRLLACCGVIPDTPRLAISDRLDAKELKHDMARGFENPLFQWLFLRGPYALMAEAAKANGISVPARDTIGGNCEACQMALTEPKYVDLIDDFLESRRQNLSHELLLLESLGMLTPLRVQALWANKSRTRVGL